MHIKMEDSLDFDASVRRKKRMYNSMKHRSYRGNPEGDSRCHKDHFKLAPVPPNSENESSFDSGVSTLRRKKKSRPAMHHLEPIEERYLARKSKRTFSDSDITGLDYTDTPDTLSQISSICPVSDSSIQTTFSKFRKPKQRTDVTFENAVQQVRGQPDGAERSFHASKKASLSQLKETKNSGTNTQELHESSDLTEQDNKPVPVLKSKPLERKKSLKVNLKHVASSAASKLKSLKNKRQIHANTSRSGLKRKLDDSQLDVTVSKKPKFKELPRKERKKMRKMLKTNHETIQRSKKIWEELRRHDISESKKTEMCTELLNMVKGNMKQYVFAHDTVRVLQCLVQHGSLDQKDQVFDEIKDDICSLAKSKYGKFFVKKLLKYGTKQHRNLIFKGFHGSVRKLVRHREASEVIEYAYNEYANATQRLALMEEFYGPSFILFKTADTKSLEQIMMQQPDKRDMILSNMKEALLPLIDKSILVYSMVHRVFFEFFSYANGKMRSEMIEAVREHLIHMCHTRDGCRVAMNCVWYGTAKDRKIIIKNFKTHLVKLCKEEYGHMALLAIFDVVDDTKLVQKVVLDEILKSLQEIVRDQYGRKVLLYILCHRSPLHFHPDIVNILKEGDQNLVSKKDKSVRAKELLEHISPQILQYLVSHARELVTENATLLLMLAILTHVVGEPTCAMEAVAKIAAEPFGSGSFQNMHIVEHPAGHITLKRLIQNDKERIQAGETVLFSLVLLKNLPDGALKSWAACNRGCFMLICLLELEHPEVQDTVVSQLTGIKKSLKKVTFKGAHILLQKLENIT